MKSEEIKLLCSELKNLIQQTAHPSVKEKWVDSYLAGYLCSFLEGLAITNEQVAEQIKARVEYLKIQ